MTGLGAVLDRNAIAERLVAIAGQAGALVRDIRAKGFETGIKPDGSPVTIADEASEALILAALARHFPAIPVISEENPRSHGAGAPARFFLVDPLDGTRAFVAGGDDFCVLIALIEDGVPVAAAIDAPAMARRWWVGTHAFAAEGDRPPRRLAQCAPRGQNERIALISSHHAGDETRRICRTLGAGTIRTENSALKFARLAEGEADIYPRQGPTMQWDIAAGDALLRALGGGVFQEDGAPLRYGYGALGWHNPNFLAVRCENDCRPP